MEWIQDRLNLLYQAGQRGGKKQMDVKEKDQAGHGYIVQLFFPSNQAGVNDRYFFFFGFTSMGGSGLYI